MYKKSKIKLRKDLGYIKKRDPKSKSPKQKKTINNIKNLLKKCCFIKS